MLMNCTNKGCMKSSNVLLDESTMEVICQECGQPIDNVSESMKRTLKSFGHVIRKNEKKSFMVACRHCKANRQVVLDDEGNTICKICHNQINLTASFKLAMEESGVKLERLKKEKENIPKKNTSKKKK